MKTDASRISLIVLGYYKKLENLENLKKIIILRVPFRSLRDTNEQKILFPMPSVVLRRFKKISKFRTKFKKYKFFRSSLLLHIETQRA